MRRGIGVDHIRKKQETEKQMANLGALMSAERLGHMEDQLELLESQLRTLAEKHKEEIEKDPIIRARFRQLADSLGIDLISSKKNIFSSILGLGDFYYGLASKIVEICLAERKYCGSFVPLCRVQSILAKRLAASSNNSSNDRRSLNQIKISEGDIQQALRKLHVLGSGYKIVELGSSTYIQTSPDSVHDGDELKILNYAISLGKKQRLNSTALQGSKITALSLSDLTHSDSAASKPFCVALQKEEILSSMGWDSYRLQRNLDRLIQDGTVWIEEKSSVPTDELPKKSDPFLISAIKGLKYSSATLKKEIRTDSVVYWFILFPQPF